MPDESVSRPARSSTSLVGHILNMPRWQKVLLTFAGILTAAGLTGQGLGLIQPKPETSQQATPENSRSVVENPDAAPAPKKPPLHIRLAPHATRIGVSLIIGFLLGWAFRVFIKTMAMIAALACAIFLGLSYFNVMNIDFSKAEGKYESSKSWVMDQAGKLKDAVKSHLPSSTATIVGMFIGFRRKS